MQIATVGVVTFPVTEGVGIWWCQGPKVVNIINTDRKTDRIAR
jgi:hypothetical protein